MVTQTTDKTAEKTKACCEDVLKNANESFKTAMETTLKCQQDAFRTMTAMFIPGDAPRDTFKGIETMTTDTIDLMRKNAEQSQKTFDEACRHGIDTFHKTFDTGHAGDKDVFARAQVLCHSAADTMRGNVELVAKSTTKAIENWSDFIGKSLQTVEKGSDK